MTIKSVTYRIILTLILGAPQLSHAITSTTTNLDLLSLDSQPQALSTINLDDLPLIQDVDILAINDEIKTILNISIAHIKNKKEMAKALHLLLFNENYLNITYSNSTKTAQQTFDTKSGNCISLASLYIASARYLGLTAKFQTLDIPREWLDENSFYIVPAHMNTVVDIDGANRTVIVEFTDTYSATETRKLDAEAISDTYALAEYYNNIGMENLQNQNHELALAALKKSVTTYPKIGFIWSNMGVLYKKNGFYEQAEAAYKKALKIDKKNLSALNNLYILYKQLNRQQEANKIKHRVIKYSNKNPHYLFKVAKYEIKLGNSKKAIKLLKKAIKISPNQLQYHLLLASAFYTEGEYNKSIDQVTSASLLDQTSTDKSRYDKKIAYIKKSYKKEL